MFQWRLNAFSWVLNLNLSRLLWSSGTIAVAWSSWHDLQTLLILSLFFTRFPPIHRLSQISLYYVLCPVTSSTSSSMQNTLPFSFWLVTKSPLLPTTPTSIPFLSYNDYAFVWSFTGSLSWPEVLHASQTKHNNIHYLLPLTSRKKTIKPRIIFCALPLLSLIIISVCCIIQSLSILQFL